MAMWDLNVNSTQYRLQFVSFDADGYTVEVLEAVGNYFVGVIALAGVAASVVQKTLPTITGAFSISTPGVIPSCGLIMGMKVTAINAQDAGINNNASAIIGGFDSAFRMGVAADMNEANAATYVDPNHFTGNDYVWAAISLTATVAAAFSITGLSGSTINCNMDVSDATAYICFVLAFE